MPTSESQSALPHRQDAHRPTVWELARASRFPLSAAILVPNVVLAAELLAAPEQLVLHFSAILSQLLLWGVWLGVDYAPDPFWRKQGYVAVIGWGTLAAATCFYQAPWQASVTSGFVGSVGMCCGAAVACAIVRLCGNLQEVAPGDDSSRGQFSLRSILGWTAAAAAVFASGKVLAAEGAIAAVLACGLSPVWTFDTASFILRRGWPLSWTWRGLTLVWGAASVGWLLSDWAPSPMACIAIYQPPAIVLGVLFWGRWQGYRVARCGGES